LYYFNPGIFFPGKTAKAQSAAPERQLAEAYVPAQKFRELYTPAEALKYGTVFRELNKQYAWGDAR